MARRGSDDQHDSPAKERLVQLQALRQQLLISKQGSAQQAA